MANTKPVGVAFSDPELTSGTTIVGATISGSTINNNVTGNLTGNVTGYVIFPTADPHVVGAVWNSSGTLTISAG